MKQSALCFWLHVLVTVALFAAGHWVIGSFAAFGLGEYTQRVGT